MANTKDFFTLPNVIEVLIVGFVVTLVVAPAAREIALTITGRK